MSGTLLAMLAAALLAPAARAAAPFLVALASCSPSLRHDVVTGDARELMADGGYARSSCLLPMAGEPPLPDPRGLPSAGEAAYFLVRARDTCAVGDYGRSSLLPDARAALAATCP